MYTIAGVDYPTKKSIEDYCKRLKIVTGLHYYPGEAEYDFLRDLIRKGHRSPNWSGFDGIQKFYVGRDGRRNTCFYFKRKGGSAQLFSYRKCIAGLGVSKADRQKRSLAAKLRSAYRVAVGDQIEEFRHSASVPCEKCGAPRRRMHVDHWKPQFAELVEAFEVSRVPPTRFATTKNSRHGKYRFRSEHREYAEAWADYHEVNAKLRMLCAKCNLSRKKS